MKIVCSATIGLLPGFGDKGRWTAMIEIDSKDQAQLRHEKFIADLEDKFDNDFVTDLGWKFVSQ